MASLGHSVDILYRYHDGTTHRQEDQELSLLRRDRLCFGARGGRRGAQFCPHKRKRIDSVVNKAVTKINVNSSELGRF